MASSPRDQTIYLAGQIGWDATTGRVVEGMAAQVEQALRNIVAVLAEASAAPTDIVRLTWFVTDMEQYRLETQKRSAKAIAASWAGIFPPCR